MSAQIYTLNNKWIKWGLVVKRFRIDTWDGQPAEITFVNGSQLTVTHQVTYEVGDFPGFFSFANPSNIKNLRLFEGFTIDYTIDLPVLTALDYLQIDGSNVTSGNISSLPNSLTWVSNLASQSTVTGNVANLPPNLYWFREAGQNTIFGNVEDIPSSVYWLDLQGQNAVSGNIGNYSSAIVNRIQVYGKNTISGDISTINVPNLDSINITGQNTITGDITLIQSTTIKSVSLQGFNTVTGDIANFQSSLTRIVITGNNTLYGNIENIPDVITFIIFGQNTISGDCGGIGSSLRHLDVRGQNTIFDYTTINFTGRTMVWFGVYGQNTLSSAEVDQILIDLSAVSTWTSSKIVYLGGNSQPRTSASDAAVASLQAQGVSITTN